MDLTLDALRQGQARKMEAGDALHPIAPGIPFDGFHSGIDEPTNTIVVFGPDPERYERELVGVADEIPVRYELRPLPVPACSQDDCVPQIYGGLDEIGGTSGFLLQKVGSSETAITAAGHNPMVHEGHGIPLELFHAEFGDQPIFRQVANDIDMDIWSLVERFWVPKDDVWEGDNAVRDMAAVKNYWNLMIGSPVWPG